MDVGYFAMPLHPPGANVTQTLDDDLEQIVTLDALGYQEAWIGEHFTAVWENIPAPDLFIAKALAMTQQIKLGTGVTCMPNHNPFMLAWTLWAAYPPCASCSCCCSRHVHRCWHSPC